jgi:hypothetical protein
MLALLDVLLRHCYFLLAVGYFWSKPEFPPHLPDPSFRRRFSRHRPHEFCCSAAPGHPFHCHGRRTLVFTGTHQGIQGCRISLEPDSCVRRTEALFEQQGAKSLPGLNAVAKPLAGIFRMPLGQIPVFRFSWRDALAYKLYGPWLFLQQRD